MADCVLSAVTARVHYLGPMNVRPTFFSDGQHRSNLVLDEREVLITNRREKSAASLDREGFGLVDHRTAVRDFCDRDAVTKTYMPEISELMTALTGAKRVVLTPAVLRWSERERHPEHVNSRPARFVHVDYSRQSFHDFARSHLADDPDQDAWLAGRYAAYNIWRVLSDPPQDCPLAMLDRRTTRRSDIIEGDAVIDAPGKPEFRFGSSLYRYDPRHRWNYYSHMTPDEALAFIAYDSDDDSTPGCPHVAFDDPTCPTGAPPRSSCEIRAYVYWGH